MKIEVFTSLPVKSLPSRLVGGRVMISAYADVEFDVSHVLHKGAMLYTNLECLREGVPEMLASFRIISYNGWKRDRDRQTDKRTAIGIRANK